MEQLSLTIAGKSYTPTQAYAQGQQLLLAGQMDQAAEVFRQLQPHTPAQALLGLASVAARQGETYAALDLVSQAHEHDPNLTDIYELYSYLCAKLKQFKAAADWARKGLALKPDMVSLQSRLAACCYTLKDTPAAVAAYERLLELKPDHAEARHILHTLKGETTSRADEAYVTSLFDGFGNFDQKLVGELSYRTPQELVSLLTATAKPAAHAWAAATDLGCGTGLCGPLLAPYCQTLVGVDLSANMLKHAEGRGYTQLVKAELTAFLQLHPAAFNLALSADTFVYIGDLTSTFAGVAQALKPGGWFAFSTEDNAENETYLLKASGRYGHAPTYISKLAFAHGFTLAAQKQAAIRTDAGQPIIGHLYVLQKA